MGQLFQPAVSLLMAGMGCFSGVGESRRTLFNFFALIFPHSFFTYHPFFTLGGVSAFSCIIRQNNHRSLVFKPHSFQGADCWSRGIFNIWGKSWMVRLVENTLGPGDFKAGFLEFLVQQGRERERENNVDP